jgi:hypothetical protein
MVQTKRWFVFMPFGNMNGLPEPWKEESTREFHEIQCHH